VDRGSSSSLPLQKMLDTWLEEYGVETLERWKAAAGGSDL
jgi:hypothetical protein